jgi:hypothetical protein
MHLVRHYTIWYGTHGNKIEIPFLEYQIRYKTPTPVRKMNAKTEEQIQTENAMMELYKIQRQKNQKREMEIQKIIKSRYTRNDALIKLDSLHQ